MLRKQRFIFFLFILLAVTGPVRSEDRIDTQDELRNMLLNSFGRNEIEICFGKDLWTEMITENFNTVRREGIKAGAYDMTIQYRDSDRLLVLSKIEWNRNGETWAEARNDEEILSIIEETAVQGLGEFILMVPEEVYQRYSEDQFSFQYLLAQSVLSDYSYTIQNGCIYFQHVSYSFEPKVICNTEENFIEAIRDFGTKGIIKFDLILCRDLFNILMENDSERLLEIQKKAGMISWNLQYSHETCTLYYDNVAVAPEVVLLNTTGEAITYLEKQADHGSEEIHLFCSAELYDYFLDGVSLETKNSTNYGTICDVLSQAGMYAYSISCSDAEKIITVYDIDYYPGRKILRLFNSNHLNELSEREMDTLQIVLAWSESARGDDPLKTAAFIHDMLCEHVDYENDENSDEDDNVIGAILNGGANCDGYSDAFFLIGSLAGLNVRCQHGKSRDTSLGESVGMEGHMWNLLEINGTWRLIDVTWDDQKNGIVYTWFNLGADRARLLHEWNEEISVPLLEKTDLTARPENEYFSEDTNSLKTAVSTAAFLEQKHFQLFINHMNNLENIFSAIQFACQENGIERYSLSYNERMHTFEIDW